MDAFIHTLLHSANTRSVRRIASFAAALALASSLEIVIFSPARRASRKLLERIVEFVRLLGYDDRIIEYNQVRNRP